MQNSFPQRSQTSFQSNFAPSSSAVRNENQAATNQNAEIQQRKILMQIPQQLGSISNSQKQSYPGANSLYGVPQPKFPISNTSNTYQNSFQSGSLNNNFMNQLPNPTFQINSLGLNNQSPISNSFLQSSQHFLSPVEISSRQTFQTGIANNNFSNVNENENVQYQNLFDEFLSENVALANNNMQRNVCQS